MEMEPVAQTVSVEWSKDETMSTELTKLSGSTFTAGQSAEFTFGKDDAIFHAETGFSFSEEELIQEGVNTANSAQKHDSGSSWPSVTISAHTALEQIIITDGSTSSVKYDCPVIVTCKVTIFSYNGCYYDDTMGFTRRCF